MSPNPAHQAFARSDRTRIGVWVLVFLVIFTGIAYWLNGKFWRDIK